ncbi:MAG: ribbon-helix-helix domain-containing protein [Hyphomonadaceae bacterium]|nr:ribbon-helix-helix domain-containing protein [Hyphomonadaceae bacterium]
MPLHMPGLVRRSLVINGHRTSLALEPEFWTALEAAARAEGVSLPALMAAIDRDRPPERLLAQAARVYALLRATAR